jgi:hypothetical protein
MYLVDFIAFVHGIVQCCTGIERFLPPSSLIEHFSLLTQFSGYEQVHLNELVVRTAVRISYYQYNTGMVISIN